MCGRYGRRGDKQFIAEHYKVLRDDFELPEEHPYAFAPDYNIAPDSFQPVLRLSPETGKREFAVMKWGLVPYWSKTSKANFSCINAKSENLETSGAWREPFKRRRCLIPAEFFYEWEPPTPEMQKKKVTRPWAIARKDSGLFSFGGIYDVWRDRSTGEWFESFSIITTDPNDVLERFHNRCPLIIDPQFYDRWLTPYENDVPDSVPRELLRTYSGEALKAWRVKPLPRGGNGPDLIVPSVEVEQLSLLPIESAGQS